MSIPPHQAIDTEHVGEIIIQSTTQSSFLPDISDPIIEGLISIASTSSSSSSSSSSASSHGSFDLLLELNSAQNGDHMVPTPKPEQELPISTKPPPVHDSIKQSPPVQTMGLPNNIPGYDPNRIPSSIFASKPVSQADWSVTSNESLFSIHMGNNSFSRDHAILLGKSEEMYKFDDLISTVPSQQPKLNEVNNISPYNLPTVIETTSDVENHRMSVSVEEDSGLRKEANVTPKPVFLNNSSNIADGRETPTRDGTRTSASTNRCSTESGPSSSSSFAFPVFMGEAGTNAPVKAVHSPRENVQHRHVEKPKKESNPESHRPIPKVVGTGWFSWTWLCRFRTFSFPCCSFCCR